MKSKWSNHYATKNPWQAFNLKTSASSSLSLSKRNKELRKAQRSAAKIIKGLKQTPIKK